MDELYEEVCRHRGAFDFQRVDLPPVWVPATDDNWDIALVMRKPETGERVIVCPFAHGGDCEASVLVLNKFVEQRCWEVATREF